MHITREQIRGYRKLMIDLTALDAEIEMLYNTYHSPSFQESGGHTSSDPGDPTVRTLHHIERKRDTRRKLIEEIKSIESFVDSIDDPEERAICRLHYLAGYTWAATCSRIRNHQSCSAIQDYDRAWWHRQAAGE